MKYLALFVFLLGSLICHGQDKVIVPRKGGIQVTLDPKKPVASLKDIIPIDEEITVFGNLVDSTVQSGSYEVREKTDIPVAQCSCGGETDFLIENNYCYQRVASGELSLDDKTFQGRIKYFFKARKTYRIAFQFSKQLPSEFSGFVQQSLVDYYRGLFSVAGLPTDVQNARIPILKKELEQEISIKASKMKIDLEPLVIPESLLDNDGKIISSLIEPTVTNRIQNFDRNVHEIDEDAKRIGQLFQNFSTASNIRTVSAVFPNAFSANLKKINEDGSYANKIGTGLVYLVDTTQASPITIINANETKIKNLIANIKENSKIIDRMLQMTEFQSDMHLLLEIYNKMGGSLEHYNSILLELSNLAAVQSELVNSNIAKVIARNFEFEETITGDFETSARWYLGADVGVAGLNLGKNTALNPTATNDSWKLLSYLGINISIIAINKKNSFWQLRKYYNWGTSLLKLTSVSLGVTMSTLDKDRYKGIFNIDSPRGFLSGIGIRPIPQVKLSAGVIWYNRNNGNALTESFNIASKTYFSASLDWDLRNILPSIKALFN
jgi:hypothetical protein